jgi:hypothetical protein
MKRPIRDFAVRIIRSTVKCNQRKEHDSTIIQQNNYVQDLEENEYMKDDQSEEFYV